MGRYSSSLRVINKYVDKRGLRQVIDNLKQVINNLKNSISNAPLGSTMSYLGTTDPSDGKWLICDGRDTTGTAIELETHYPNLYMFLGGTNVLPYIVDRNSPLDYTRMVTRNLGGSSTDTWTATDAGLIVAPFVGFNGAYGYVSVNGVTITRASTPNNQVGAQCGACSVFVEKGDVIKVCNNYHTVANTWSFIPFSKYKIIKATSSSDTYHVPNQEVVQIKQYFDEGLSKVASYSTEEVWTGGYWIDGKKIYRTTLVNDSYSLSENNWTSLSAIFSNFPSLNVDSVIAKNLRFVSNSQNKICSSNDFGMTNEKLVLYDITPKSNSRVELTFEYTKL